MTKETLKLALEALEDLGMKHYESTGEVLYKETFAAIKEALANDALEKKAENARELGLDYEPEQKPKCGAIIEVFGKDWRLEYMSLPVGKHKLYTQQYTYTTPPQRTWVGLTDEDIALIDWESLVTKKDCVKAIEAKLKEKNT